MFTIVCLGDSITCEWEEPHYPTYWQELCNQKFGQGKYKIIAAGVNGETAADAYSRLDQDVLLHDPDLVTIMFGHNDIFQGLAPSRYLENLTKIIAYLQNKTTAKIWLLSPNRVTEPQVVKIYEPYLAGLKALATEQRVPYVDLWSVPVNCPWDYLHPDASGHRLLAAALFHYLESTI